jgi:hypothetical protein
LAAGLRAAGFFFAGAFALRAAPRLAAVLVLRPAAFLVAFRAAAFRAAGFARFDFVLLFAFAFALALLAIDRSSRSLAADPTPRLRERVEAQA